MLNGFFGGLGDGKTLLQTIFAKDIVEREDYEVYANYKIADSRIKVITPIDLIEINPEVKRALINLDEVYAWLESRMSMSKINRVLSWIILQSRKRNMDICYTAQLTSTVDIRLRSLTDMAWVCEKQKAGFKYKLFWQRGLRIHARRFFLPLKNAEKFYPMYDTREIIKPIGIDKLKKELAEQDLDLYTEIEGITDKMIPLTKDMKLTRSVAQYFLLKMGKPLKYADLIQTALKMRGIGKTWQIV